MLKSKIQLKESEKAPRGVYIPKIDALPQSHLNAKIFELGFEGECPECNTAFTRVKVYIPVETLPTIGPTPPRQWLREKEGEVFLDCDKRCCLKWIPFRAYIQAYNEVLRQEVS